MTTVYFDRTPDIQRVCKVAFPNYKGRKFKVQFDTKQMSVRSYWSGGSRTCYALVRLKDLEVHHAPDSHPMFDRVQVDVDNVTIPEGFVIVGHSNFCGKDMGLTIYTPAPNTLIQSGDLDDDVAQLLIATAGLKSSYGGRRDYRGNALIRTLGWSRAKVVRTRAKAMELEYMTKRKAITTAGRNAISGHKDRNRGWRTW